MGRGVNLVAPVRYVSVSEALAACAQGLVVTDRNVAKHYAERIPKGVRVLSLPSGERTKSLANLGKVWAWLAREGATRESTLVALGGGVVGDLAGFAAATYMRGIRTLQIPTTLMAMVDSAHGGKTGINLPEGKNLAGVFAAPSEVLVAVGFLSSLPAREFRAGCAEVWKYGAISDPKLLARLETSPLTANTAVLADTVRVCVQAKNALVRRDPLETKGERAALNFGHTIGHAIEAATGYGKVLHGEAVAIGMVAEAKLGEQLGLTEPGFAERLREGLQRQGLPVDLPGGLDAGELVTLMMRDKKRSGAGLSFSLVTRPGECKLVQGVEAQAVVSSLLAE